MKRMLNISSGLKPEKGVKTLNLTENQLKPQIMKISCMMNTNNASPKMQSNVSTTIPNVTPKSQPSTNKWKKIVPNAMKTSKPLKVSTLQKYTCPHHALNATSKY